MRSENFENILFKTPTIHRLNLAAINLPNPTNEGLTEERIGRLLKRLVGLYNHQLGDQSHCYRFKEMPINQRLCEGTDNCQFRIWCVWRKISYESTGLAPFVQALGAEEDFSSSSTETVVFFYRENEHGTGDAFALAEGVAAWHLFARYRDAFFARILAKRMLANPISRLKTRPLIGDKTQTDNKHDNLRYVQETKQGLAWIEGVTARTKEEAFPESLSRLRKALPPLTMKEKALTLHTSVKVKEWFPLIDHLSQVYRQSLDHPDEYDVPEFSFLTNLQPADLARVPALTRAISEEVWRVFSSEGNTETALRFAPHQSEEYHHASVYSFSKIGNKVKSDRCWTHHLSTVELIRNLAIHPFQDFADRLQKRGVDSDLKEQFINDLSKLNLYYAKGGNCHSTKFLKGLEGEIILSNGEHFFHVKEEWMQPRLDFFASLHRDFAERLGRSLIRPEHELWGGHLPLPWIGHQKDEDAKDREDVEGKYNLSYVDKPHFIVGDKATPRSIEIFDLLFHDENNGRIYLIQVKATFGGGSRAAAFQIMCAADAIRAIRSGDVAWLQELVQELKTKNPAAYKGFIKWGGKEDPQQKLLNLIQHTPSKNIIFVYAIADTRAKSHHLEDELQLVQAFTEPDFEEMLEAFHSPDCSAADLKSHLCKKKIIDQHNRLTTKGLICFEKGGKEQFLQALGKDLGEENADILYEEIKRRAATKFNSSIPRFCMLKAARHIENKGFSFAIDQISSQGDSLLFTDALGSVLSLESLPVCDTKEWGPGSTLSIKDEEYVLEPTLNTPVHAVLGKWNAEESAYCWELNKHQERFVEKIRKRLAAEKSKEGGDVSKVVRQATRQLLHYVVPTNGPSLPPNAQGFWKQLDSKSPIGRKAKKYVEQRRAYEQEYPNFTLNMEQELTSLKKCLEKMKEKSAGRAAEHPNRFIQLLSADKKSLTQGDRIKKIEHYNQNPQKLTKDYNANRKDLAKYLLERKHLLKEEESLQNVYRGEQALEACNQLFEDLKPVKLYLSSLAGSRRYGLEEAIVASSLTKRSVHIYRADPDDPEENKLLSGDPKKTPDRIVFMNVYKERHLFSVCCPKGEEHLLAALPPLTMDSSGSVEKPFTPAAPLPKWMSLRNIGNSCYLDATLQALFASELLCEQVRNAEATDENEDIHKALLNLLNNKVNNQKSLKKAIFDSQLHPEFTPEFLKAQLDAASVLELLSEHFFEPLEMSEYRTVPGLEGLKFPSPTNTQFFILQVPLSRASSLREAINNVFASEINDAENKWLCTPSEARRIKAKNAYVISEEVAHRLKRKPTFETARYDECLKFQEMPEVLTVHLKRFLSFDNQPIKLNQSLHLPSNGIIYLTEDCAVTAEEYGRSADLKARYRIKSYVTHEGDTLDGGHYRSYLERNGRFYQCDDMESKPQKITEEEFLERGDAYLVVLEKIQEE